VKKIIKLLMKNHNLVKLIILNKLEENTKRNISVHDKFVKLGGKHIIPYDTIVDIVRGNKDFKENILKSFNIRLNNNKLTNNESKIIDSLIIIIF
jgi:hypothetical protein